MTLLSKYLIKQNLFLLLTILLIGTGIYLLTDLFDRIDDFLETKMSFFAIVAYFVIKIPIIISQILPAVFLIALIIQLNLLTKNKELVALHAGGISPMVLVKFVLLYGLFWAVCQFTFSEVIGVKGDRLAVEIWKEQVRGQDLKGRSVSNLWFIDKSRFFYVSKAYPELAQGEHLRVYILDDDGVTVQEILQAPRFTIEDKNWKLTGASRITVGKLTVEQLPEVTVPIKNNLRAFLLTDAATPPEQLPLWELGSTIKRLEKAGISVEALLTVWHNKLSYACSLIVMGLLGLAISQRTQNIYKGVGLGLLCIFIFYAANTFCNSMGKKGILAPIVGAWATDVVAISLLILILIAPLVQIKKAG